MSSPDNLDGIATPASGSVVGTLHHQNAGHGRPHSTPGAEAERPNPE